MLERWKPIIVDDQEWPYLISGFGRVMRIRTSSNTKAGKILKPKIDRYGYPVVTLYHPTLGRESRKMFTVHRLVAQAFLGPPSSGYQVNHRDGNKENNYVENIEWVTPKENIQHAEQKGLRKHLRGVDVGGAKLTERDVVTIRRLAQQGKSQGELARLFGVCFQNISLILNGHSWSWVTKPHEQLSFLDEAQSPGR